MHIPKTVTVDNLYQSLGKFSRRQIDNIDDIFLFLPKNGLLYLTQNLHEVSKHIFLKKKENQNVVYWIFTRLRRSKEIR